MPTIINFPKVGDVSFPDNLSPDQFQALVTKLAEKYDFPIPKPEASLGTIFKRGFMRSMGETGIALADTLPAMVASNFSFDDYAKKQMEEAQTSREKLEREYPTRFKSYKDIASPFEAIQYGAETLGELVPTAGAAMIPGIGGEALGARVAGRAALEAATTAGPPTRAALAGVTKAAEAGGRAGMYGGVFMGSYAQNAPEIFEGIYRETGKFEPGLAALTGGLSAVLDSVTPGRVLDTLGPYGKLKVIEKLAKDSGAAPKVWKSIGLAATKSAATEGLTEAAQESIGAFAEQVAGSSKGLLDPENIQRYKEAFVKGAIGGVGFGAPEGISQYRTAKRDVATTKEAQDALNAQAQAEAAARAARGPTALQQQIEGQFPKAGRTQEDMEAAIADNEARKAREMELNALASRMDELRPGSQAYADLEAQVQKAKDEIAAIDAKKAEESAFTTAKPTPGTGGMFMPGVEKARTERKVSQEQGMRGFAFGDMGATNAPADPVTVDVLKALRIPATSKLGNSLLGLDMATQDGVRQFIQIMEDPAKVGMTNVNEENYTKVLDSLYADGRGNEVEQARAEMKAEVTSPTKAKQQAATRAFAFGDQNVAEPVTDTSGRSTGVVSEPTAGVTTEAVATPERDGVVSTGENVGESAVGEGQPAVAVSEAPNEPAPAVAPAPAPAPAVPTEGRKKAPRTATEIAVAEDGKAPTAVTFAQDLAIANEKLGKKGKLTQEEKDAKAYFGKVVPELALKSIANDLVYQPTAYRNSKMTSLKGEPEMMFGTKAEAEFFKGQGGIHAKRAAEWVRANMSKEAVIFLDKHIKLYEKENQRSQAAAAKQDKQQKIKKATKEQVKTEKQSEKKATLQQVIDDVYFGEVADETFDDIVNDGRTRYDASPETAALHNEAHPAVLELLARGDLTGALEALADSPSSVFAGKIAGVLSKLMGNVKLVYGAEKAQYDPETNTIYLPANATEYEILHEAAHAGLSHIIDNASHPVTRQLQQIFDDVKADIDGAYGAKDLQEFVAEFWSNDAFRTQLSEKYGPGNKLSVWDKIMNVIRRALGFQPKTSESVTDTIDRLLNDIVSVPPDQRIGNTLYAQSIHTPNIAEKIFNGTDHIINHQTLVTPERAAAVLGAMEKTGLSLRAFSQKFLNLSALGQVGAKLVGKSSIEFADKVNEMAGYYQELSTKLQPLKERLQEFSRTENYDFWCNLVNDSTLEDVNPAAPRSKYTGSPEKLAAWDDLNRRYNRLTETEKKLYNDHFGSFKVLFKELKDSIRNHMDATFEDKDQAMTAYQKIIDQITKMGIDHYSPLFRSGEYWMQYVDKDTNETVQRLFDTQAERRLAKAKAEEAGHTGIEEYSRVEGMKPRNVPRGTVAAQIVKIMKDGGAEDTAVEKFLELIVSALPETSLLKSFQTRKGTPGYERDVAKAFASVTDRTARQLSRMRYNEPLQKLLDDVKEKAALLRGDDGVRAKELWQELEARREFAMSPTFSDWARYASTGSFYFNLAGNVSSAVVNTTSVPLIVLPQLGGVYGFANAGRAILAATKLFGESGISRKILDINGQEVEQRGIVRVGMSIENLIGHGKLPQYKELFSRLDKLGLLVESMAHEALDPKSMEGIAQKVAVLSASMFHQAERYNREITAVAAYELELAKSGNKEAAIEKAIRLVEFAHGAGHTESGPSIGHSDVGKVLTVFKRFGFSMYYMLFNTINRALPVEGATGKQLEEIQAARRQLRGIYGMSALFAGVKGLPLYWILQAAYDATHDDDEEDFDTMMRRYLGEFAFKGPVNYITNLGIADRVGWTDLIYRENKNNKADASALSGIMEAVLGAPYAIVNNLFRAQQLAADGHMERAIETALPIGIRNAFKGIRYATEGANTLRGDPVMGEVNGYNAAMQVLGFAPADLLAQYEVNAYAKKMGDEVHKQEKSLLKKYYVAQREGDYDRANELEDKLYALGDKYPELGITNKTLTASVKARDKISEEMYHGVQLDRKLRPRIEEAIRELEPK